MRVLLGTSVALLLGGTIGYFVAEEGRGAPGGVDAPVHAATRQPPAAAPARALPSKPDLADRALLVDLLQEVRDLGDLVRALGGADGLGASRVPVDDLEPGDVVGDRDESSSRHAELRSWMTRIESGLGNLAKSPGTLPLIDLPPEGLRPTPLPVPLPEDEDQEAFGSSHLLWSFQDVLEAYGRPDIVHDGTEWEYTYKGEVPAESELSDVHFSFSNGFVTSMYAH